MTCDTSSRVFGIKYSTECVYWCPDCKRIEYLFEEDWLDKGKVDISKVSNEELMGYLL